ncbi:MAG TPA: tripartite tricarboxylate transporter substrate binding protein [Burkholderiales bacterium]|nr:tripartite tricarboxylate transporter substrate binding protein [Burkholderiales bacterium]
MRLLLVIALTALAATIAPHVNAQAYPTKPIRLIVPFTPGGGVDINARLVAQKLTEYLGQQIIVESRPGAGTNIGNEYVAKSAPDGYTLLINSGAVAINMALYKNLNYNSPRDFVAVSLFSESPNVLVVHPSLPVKSAKELVALAKSRPGAMNFSSSGSGTTQHLSGELFNLRTGVKIIHVPFRGTAPSLTAVVGGEIEVTFANIPAISGFVKAGRLRPLATTGLKRAAQMPDIPTLTEQGMDVEVTVRYGIFAPSATPREVVNILAAAIAKAARSPDTRQRLLDQGAEPVGNTPEEFGKIMQAEYVRWAEVVKVSGAKAD